jgi:hypothetical protein
MVYRNNFAYRIVHVIGESLKIFRLSLQNFVRTFIWKINKCKK